MQEDAHGSFGQTTASGHVLGGIIHAGGVLADAGLGNQTNANLRAVVAAKSHGVAGCHRHTSSFPTRFEVRIWFVWYET